MEKAYLGYYDKEKKNIFVGKAIGVGKSQGYQVGSAIAGAKKLNKVLILMNLDGEGKISKIFLPIKARSRGMITGAKVKVISLSGPHALTILPYLSIKDAHYVTRWAWIRYNLEEARKANAKDEGVLKTLQMIENEQIK